MAKNTVADWDTTAANNTDIGGINIAEGWAAADVNNAFREAMAQIKTAIGVSFQAYDVDTTKNDVANTFTADQTLSSTDAGAAHAPTYHLLRASASPAASDLLAVIQFEGKDSVGNSEPYARVSAQIVDPTNGSEDGRLFLQVLSAASIVNPLQLDGSAATFTVPVLVPDGSAAAPSIAASGDTDTGIHFPAANALALGTAGVEKVRLTGTSFLVGATAGWANDSGTEDGVNITTAGQIVCSNTSNTAGSWRRQGTDGRLHNFYKDTTLSGGIDVASGTATFVGTSDGNLKIDRVPIEQELDLDAIHDALGALAFTMLNSETLQPIDGRLFGQIAQDVYAFVPLRHLVTVGHGVPGDKDYSPWMLDYTGLHTVLIACVGHRQKKLEARLDAAGL